MALPVASALSRRDRLWPALGASVAAHVVLILWGLTRQPPPPIDLEQKAIVAKLVRLGEKKPEQWLPRREEAAAPAPPAPVAVPVPAAPVAPRPAAPRPGAKPAPTAPAPAPAGGKAGGTSLASILSKVQRQQDERRYGDPSGDPAGDSESGSEGDRYLGAVVQQLKRNYDVPKTIPSQDLLNLKATVILRIDAAGRIAGHEFERRSGNPSYDAALERAIARTQLPAPPPALRDHYGRLGLGVNFHL
ncbi:MAG TPA: energy transducer TonB [Anaeromyxobacter sp.]